MGPGHDGGERRQPGVRGIIGVEFALRLRLHLESSLAQGLADRGEPGFPRAEQSHLAPGLRAQLLERGLFEPDRDLPRFMVRLGALGWIFSSRLGLDSQCRDLTGQNGRARVQLDEADLPIRLVKKAGESGVDKVHLGLVEAECDSEFDGFACAGLHERVVDPLILLEISALSEDGLLKIADHAEVAGPRSVGASFQPASLSFGWSGNFQQDGELLRIRVLGFVQDDAKISLANARGRGGLLHQLVRQADLVVVSQDTAVEPEFAISRLHFGGHGQRATVQPFSKWAKGLVPGRDKFFVLR